MSTMQGPEPGWAAKIRHARVKPLVADAGGAGDAGAGTAVERVLIAECIHRYGWGYDERDRDLLTACFTADAVWEGCIMGRDPVGPCEGRDAVVQFLVDFWETQSDQRRHIFTNVVVDDLGETDAVAHAYLVLTASSEGTMTPITNGPYRLTMRKEDGVWRIARLTAGFDAPF